MTEDEERLIKLTLNGLLGPMEVKGKAYPGLVPMTPFGGMLSDQELADVLSFVRNSWGNRAAPITARRVQEVRVATQSKEGYYSPEELMGGAATVGRSFVKFWELSDFESTLGQPLRGRDFERGREMFQVATCVTCHNMEGVGGKVGADLSKVGEEYSGIELLQQILDPSASIKDEHRLYAVDLDDESTYFGQIVERTEASLTIAENLQQPDVTITFDMDEVVELTPLALSPMPTGTLVTLIG